MTAAQPEPGAGAASEDITVSMCLQHPDGRSVTSEAVVPGNLIEDPTWIFAELQVARVFRAAYQNLMSETEKGEGKE